MFATGAPKSPELSRQIPIRPKKKLTSPRPTTAISPPRAQAKRTLSWKRVDISGDTIKFDAALGWKGTEDEGSVYLATWIYAPAPTAVKLKELDGHGHHALRGWLNDVALPVVLPPGQNAAGLQQSLDPNAPVTLQAGWNKLLLRWDLIWGDNEMGVILDALPEKTVAAQVFGDSARAIKTLASQREICGPQCNPFLHSTASQHRAVIAAKLDLLAPFQALAPEKIASRRDYRPRRARRRWRRSATRLAPGARIFWRKAGAKIAR